MKIEQGAFPYPVLTTNGLEVQGSFENAIKPSTNEPARDKYVFTNSISLSNETLETALKTGSAVRMVHIECGRTRYRKCFSLNEDGASIEIPEASLDGRVELSTFLAAAEALPNYKNSAAHEGYQDQSFEVERGQILAVAPLMTFEATKDGDSFRNLDGIFLVNAKDKKDPLPIKVDLELDKKVVISLPPEEHKTFKGLNDWSQEDTRGDGNFEHGVGPALHQAIVIPAVMEMLSALRNRPDDILDLAWGRALKEALKNSERQYELIEDEKRFQPDDPDIAVAQVLFRNFLSRALQGLNEYVQGNQAAVALEEGDED